MSVTLPVTFRASALPSNFRGTPQQFLDALVARLAIETDTNYSIFTIGSTPPLTNVGPFLKNGTTWYVWDSITGSYVPEKLDSLSLRYIVANTQPSASDYTIWIETDAGGKAIAIKTYYAGGWKDIYEDTFNKLKGYPAAAKLTGSQTLSVDGNFYKVIFNQSILDPFTIYDNANSQYIAPVAGVYRASTNIQVDNNTANHSQAEFGVKITTNNALGDPLAPTSGVAVKDPPGDRWYPQVTGLLNLAAGDSIQVYLESNDGASGHDVIISPNSQFCIELVHGY